MGGGSLPLRPRNAPGFIVIPVLDTGIYTSQPGADCRIKSDNDIIWELE